MDQKLAAVTEPGRRYLSLCEQHAADFATRVDQHDRDNSFAFENFAAMKQSGVMAAMVPQQFGGLGVESLHDMAVGVSRLGAGDPSTALAANMHIASGYLLVGAWNAARAAEDPAAADLVAGWLRRIGAGEIMFALLGTEPATDQFHPLVEARPVEGGYRVTGRKVFGTGSPLADYFYTFLKVTDENGKVEIAVPVIPRDLPGLEVKDNWDALGMRGSGSNNVIFNDCFISTELMGKTRVPFGEWSPPWFHMVLAGNLGLLGAFHGIAKAAHEVILNLVKTYRKAPSGRPVAERPAIQNVIAEIEIDISAARAVLAQFGLALDRFYQQSPPGTEVLLADLHRLMKDFECAKWFVTNRAVAIVDRAITASGGSGYLSRSPLSRMYRDVRAGPIMQLYSPNEQFEYIGKVTLDLPIVMTG